MSRQCELIGLNRSIFYYEPVGVSELNLRLMRLIDEHYTRMPFLGVPKMTACLVRAVGFPINPKRVERLMRLMGLQAIRPKRKRTSQGGGKVYPYLLRQMRIERPDQVWCTDITYIPLDRGFLYLVAIMDWFSRFVLAWELSNSLDRFFCVNTLDRALRTATPEVFHSDQGSQFTSKEFTGRLEAAQIRISMDGRARFWERRPNGVVGSERIHRAAVAKRQIRGGVHERLRGRMGSPTRTGRLLPALQHRATPSGVGLPDARRGLSEIGPMKTGCHSTLSSPISCPKNGGSLIIEKGYRTINIVAPRLGRRCRLSFDESVTSGLSGSPVLFKRIEFKRIARVARFLRREHQHRDRLFQVS